jgi:hypothetical protein
MAAMRRSNAERAEALLTLAASIPKYYFAAYFKLSPSEYDLSVLL